MNKDSDIYIPSAEVKAIFDSVFDGQHSRFVPNNNKEECAQECQVRHFCVQVHLLAHYAPTYDELTSIRAKRTLAYLSGMLRAEVNSLLAVLDEAKDWASRVHGKELSTATAKVERLKERMQPIEDALLAAALAQ